jgi:hypothetical protein
MGKFSGRTHTRSWGFDHGADPKKFSMNAVDWIGICGAGSGFKFAGFPTDATIRSPAGSAACARHTSVTTCH